MIFCKKQVSDFESDTCFFYAVFVIFLLLGGRFSFRSPVFYGKNNENFDDKVCKIV